ncbi:MAG TPA: GNAT family N-acetyltransferase [Terracidiphilus sp.]|nr:GNAT family N-acetyltransferase [Terracidiphilus sp.]
MADPSEENRQRPGDATNQAIGAIAPPVAGTGNLRIATAHDIRFIDSLQKKFARAVGFLPKIAIEHYTEQGSIRLALENDDPAGYILSKPHLIWQPAMRSITQAAVAMDAQRRHHGLALLKQIEAESRAAGLIAIQACCAVGLESNEFWHAAGFRPIVHMTPSNARGREVICWRLPLTKKLPLWFIEPPARAGWRAAKPQSVRDPNRCMDATNIARRYTTTSRKAQDREAAADPRR